MSRSPPASAVEKPRAYHSCMDPSCPRRTQDLACPHGGAESLAEKTIAHTITLWDPVVPPAVSQYGNGTEVDIERRDWSAIRLSCIGLVAILFRELVANLL